ncbi:MAG: hypothetical protein JWQ40_2196, partial [Segetibacter sp.]|nr:hypothetical protein [Segetibacter sp.]
EWLSEEFNRIKNTVLPGDGIISGKGEATAMKATGEKRDADERIATVRAAQDELLCC